MDSFSRDGLVFDVRDTGPADGEPVVCLHGFPQDARAFDGVTARLTERGVRVLAPDQRGYSPGARPRDVRAYALGEAVADVLALLDAAGLESAHVVGHDWGGAVGWALAGRHPDRVRGLTALSTPHPRALRAAVRSSQPLRSAYMAFFQLPRVPEAVLLAGGGVPLRLLLGAGDLPRPLARHYADRMREPGALSGGLAWYRAIPFSAGAGSARCSVPTTYLWGRRDPFFSPVPARETRRYVTGPFTERPLDAGHWLPETRPAEVTDAVLEQIGRSRR